MHLQSTKANMELLPRGTLHQLLGNEMYATIRYSIQRAYEIILECEVEWTRMPESNVRVELRHLSLYFGALTRNKDLEKVDFIKSILQTFVAQTKQIRDAPLYLPPTTTSENVHEESNRLMNEYKNHIRNLMDYVTVYYVNYFNKRFPEDGYNVFQEIREHFDAIVVSH